MSRIPLRLRLVAGFSATMFLVLAAAGAFVYWRVEYALDRGLDTELDSAVATLGPLVADDGTMKNQQAADATGVAWQVVRPDGVVVVHGGPAGARRMVSSTVLDRAATTETVADTGHFLPPGDTTYRLHVDPLPGTPDLLVVGVRRDHRDEALRELLLQLTLAGLAALAVTALVGDRLARAALAPVERYRRRAEEISHGAAGLRLDVPPGRDDEVTRLGHTLNEMLAELERSIERERRFVDEASHELRTPLTLLSSRIQVTRRRSRTVAEHEAVLDELSTDVARLADLAEQLLELGAAAATEHPTDAATDVVAALDRAALGREPGQVIVEPPGQVVPEAAVPPGDLDRVVTNLVDNALSHGRAPVTIRVRGVADDECEWVCLEVRDAGAGMEPALLATATDRFTRASEARARPGAGLGLALVAGLVARAGGELRLCHAGHHQPAKSTHNGVPCDHGREMTVTVLLRSVHPG